MFMIPAVADASCVPAGQGAAPVFLDSFKARPDMLLEKHPLGEGALVSDVRNLAVSDPETIKPIVALAAKAIAQQKFAIGAGLGQSAMICREPEPLTAQAIQEAIAELGDSDIEVAFLSSTGQRSVGAVGGGGTGGGQVGGGGFAGPVGSYTSGPGGILPGGSVPNRRAATNPLTGDDTGNLSLTRRRGNSATGGFSGSLVQSVSP